MADPNIKISITADDNASKKLKDLDDQVGKTGKGMGGLGKAAAIGGAALVALGVKSVLAFEDLGLTVGKFADATGVSAEQASRLIEVGDDLGISSDTLASGIGKMSKQLGANGDAFKAYGVEVAKNNDGTTDMNQTFLNAVDAINKIQDPLKKAEASAKIFGKGYQGMAELLGESSDKIKADLASVSDQKVFDEEKVKKARDMRDALDTVKDAGEDLLLTIGSALAPVITQLAPTLKKVVDAAGPLAVAIGKTLASALEVVGPILEGLLPVIEQVAKALGLVANVIGTFKPTGFTKDLSLMAVSFDEVKQKAADAGITTEEFAAMMVSARGEVHATGDTVKDMTTFVGLLDEKVAGVNGTVETAQNTTKGYSYALQDVADSTKDAAIQADEYARHSKMMADDVKRDLERIQGAWDALSGNIDADKSLLNLQGTFDEVKVKAEAAFAAAAAGAEDSEQQTRDAQLAADDLKLAVIDYGKEVLGLPPQKVTEFLAMIDAGQLDAVEAALNNLARNRQMNIDITTKGGAGYGTGPQFAEGGVVPGPVGAPMAATVHGGEMVLTPEQQASVGGTAAAGPMTINITMPVGSNGDDVVRKIKEYEKRNGPGWRGGPGGISGGTP